MRDNRSKVKAAAITEGVAVKHSGEFWHVLAVEVRPPVVTCITPDGGRISFMASDVVEVVE